MEHQMEKNMDHELDTGNIWGVEGLALGQG